MKRAMRLDLLALAGQAEEAAEQLEALGRALDARRPPRAGRQSGRKLVNAPSALLDRQLAASCRAAPRGRSAPAAAARISSLKPVRPARRPAPRAGSRRSPRPCSSGRSNGIPFQPSTIRSEEAPIPSAKRPPVASASAAACWASSAGPRVKTPTTPVPRRSASRPGRGQRQRREAVGAVRLAAPDVGVAGRLGARTRPRGRAAASSAAAASAPSGSCWRRASSAGA